MPPTEPTEPTPTPSPKRRRRWWSLSVRGLMILVLLVGGLIGWEVNRVDRMRRALAVLHRSVATVPGEHNVGLVIHFIGQGQPADSKVQVAFDDWHEDGEYLAEQRPTWLPDRVRSALGEDHFRRVVGLEFERRPTPEDWEAIGALGTVQELKFDYLTLTDDDLAGLTRCPGLRVLGLAGTKITDKTMPLLGTFPDLRKLDLGLTAITDLGLAPLAKLAQLRELRFGAEAGTDAGLAHLRGLVHLRVLDNFGSEGGITDAGLAHLRGLTQLEELGFTAHHITDAGMGLIAGFPHLKLLRISPRYKSGSQRSIVLSRAGVELLARLDHLETLHLDTLFQTDDTWLAAVSHLAQLRDLRLSGIEITDTGLAHLGGLVRLEKLRITSPRVTDAGLKPLQPLTRLTELSFYARVTPEGLQAFQATHPTLKFIRTDPCLIPIPPEGDPANPEAPMMPLPPPPL